MTLSQSAQERDVQAAQLQNLMRHLQMEDEDPAMAIAIANSLKGQNQMDSELADLEQVWSGLAGVGYLDTNTGLHLDSHSMGRYTSLDVQPT